MKKQILIIIGVIILVITSCNQKENNQLTDEEVWKLGWRMIASSMNENYSVANLQFDTLRRKTKTISRTNVKKTRSGKSTKTKFRGGSCKTCRGSCSKKRSIN